MKEPSLVCAHAKSDESAVVRISWVGDRKDQADRNDMRGGGSSGADACEQDWKGRFIMMPTGSTSIAKAAGAAGEMLGD